MGLEPPQAQNMISVSVRRSDIFSIRADGNDLVLLSKDGQVITIRDGVSDAITTAELIITFQDAQVLAWELLQQIDTVNWGDLSETVTPKRPEPDREGGPEAAGNASAGGAGGLTRVLPEELVARREQLQSGLTAIDTKVDGFLSAEQNIGQPTRLFSQEFLSQANPAWGALGALGGLIWTGSTDEVGAAPVASVGEGHDNNPISELQIIGNISLGPIIEDNDLQVFAFDRFGNRIGMTKVVEAETGAYSITVPGGFSGPIILKVLDAEFAAGGARPDYVDEAWALDGNGSTPLVKDLEGSVWAVGVAVGSGVMKANINPLTSMSAKKLLDPTTTDGSSPSLLHFVSDDNIIETNTSIAELLLGVNNFAIISIDAELVVDIDGNRVFGNLAGELLEAVSRVEASTGLSTEQVVNLISEFFVVQPDWSVKFDGMVLETNEHVDSSDPNSSTGIFVAAVSNRIITALTKIEAYAESNGAQPAPTVDDYVAAGVTRVTETNLPRVNAAVAAVSGQEADTQQELQALVDVVLAAEATAHTITGDTTGAVTEDTDVMLTASGQLSITGDDTGEVSFSANNGIQGIYGTLAIKTNGEWAFSVNNNLRAIQSLGDGDTLTDTFTVTVLDGTASETVVITINGVDDNDFILGSGTGAVTEDDPTANKASGKVYIEDDTDGGGIFAEPDDLQGIYGTFTFNMDTGDWTYTLDNNLSATSSLTDGETVKDELVFYTDAGTISNIEIEVTGVNDIATISGTNTGSLTEDDAATLTTSGKLTVADDDAGQAVFVAKTNTAGYHGYGTFSIDANGNWTYSANNGQAAIQGLGNGDTLTDTITVSSADGTATETISVTITGVNDRATITGTATGEVTEDDDSSTLTATGTLNVTDLDAGEASFAAKTVLAIYGSFTIDANGTWTYTADNTQDAIQALFGDETLQDTLTVISVDGTTQDIIVTINGNADTIDLSAVAAGTGGFVINGEEAGDLSGWSVSSAGDVNDDGFDDLIVGAPNGNGGTGAAYVVFGSTSPTISIELSSLNGTAGFKITGAALGDKLGWSVGSAGDVNGDGHDDLIVGAYYANGGYGESYVVFGSDSASNINLSNLGKAGVSLMGEGGFSGFSVSSAGDVNGDGFDDLIIGAYYANNTGTSYVVFGGNSLEGGTINLGGLDGTDGFAILGEGTSTGVFDDEFGVSVSAAGDVNGDGIDDMIIGARYANDTGNAYVVFGSTAPFDPTLNVADLDGNNGFAITGSLIGSWTGFSVSSAGDVNGDGIDDLFIGNAYGGIPDNAPVGYVIFGQSVWADPTLNLAEVANGNGGFIIKDTAANKNTSSVSSAGDLNGDGFDDLILGTWHSDAAAAQAYVIFGSETMTNTIDLADIAVGKGGFLIDGVDAIGFDIGFSVDVSAAGDVNGDGFDDLIIGSTGVDANGGNSGASYVVYGDNFTDSVTRAGTSESETLQSVSAGDRMLGGRGSDTFKIADLQGTITIVDFARDEGDLLDLGRFGIFDISEVIIGLTGVGNQHTLVGVDADTFVVLERMLPNELVLAQDVI